MRERRLSSSFKSNIFETHRCYVTSGRRYFICFFPAAPGEPVHPWELKFSPPPGEDSEARCRLCWRLPESAVLAGSAFAEPQDTQDGIGDWKKVWVLSYGRFRTTDSLGWKKLPLGRRKKEEASAVCPWKP